MVEVDVKSNKRIMDVLKDLQLPRNYWVDIKPDKHGDKWHEDIVARKIDPSTGSTLDTIKVRRFLKSSLDAPVANTGPY